jgi:hypothetical protein
MAPTPSVPGSLLVPFLLVLVFPHPQMLNNPSVQRTDKVHDRVHVEKKTQVYWYMRGENPTDCTLTKTPFRRWYLPPTQRTPPIQPSCSIVFCSWVHNYLLNPTAKVIELLCPLDISQRRFYIPSMHLLGLPVSEN